MFNNNQFQQPFGAAQGQGYPTYGVAQQPMQMYAPQPMKQPEYTNPLGREKIKELLSKGNGGPKINLTEDDFIRAICTHRFEGHTRTVEIGDNKVRCEICGAEFEVVDDASIDDVKYATEHLMNILQTAKIAWLDMPDKTGSEFFQALAVIEKTPELFKIAMSNFAKYNGVNPQSVNMPVNGFSMMNQLTGIQPMMGMPMGMPMGQPMMQQPQMGYPSYQVDAYGNPVYANYNQAAQQMQQNAPGVNNGFGYTAAPAPEANNGNGNKQQAAPNKGETVTKTLSV